MKIQRTTKLVVSLPFLSSGISGCLNSVPPKIWTWALAKQRRLQETPLVLAWWIDEQFPNTQSVEIPQDSFFLFLFSILLHPSPKPSVAAEAVVQWEPKTLRKENLPLQSDNTWSQKNEKNFCCFLSLCPSFICPWHNCRNDIADWSNCSCNFLAGGPRKDYQENGKVLTQWWIGKSLLK